MKRIEERLMDELKLALNHKDHEAAKVTRELLAMISDYKMSIYPTVATDLMISRFLETAEYKDDAVKERSKKYIVNDAKNVLLNIYADKIVSDLKSIAPPEEFMRDLTELVIKRWNLKQS